MAHGRHPRSEQERDDTARARPFGGAARDKARLGTIVAWVVAILVLVAAFVIPAVR